jgi:hypothetical protein
MLGSVPVFWWNLLKVGSLTVYWDQLRRFHLKTDTQSSLRIVVFTVHIYDSYTSTGGSVMIVIYCHKRSQRAKRQCLVLHASVYIEDVNNVHNTTLQRKYLGFDLKPCYYSNQFNSIQFNSIQLNSLLFMCRVNSHRANYRPSTVQIYITT